MIDFLYILLLLIWHMYFFGVCILHIVSCHNYMHYVCETLKMLENVVKRSELCTPENSAIQKLSIIIIYYYQNAV